VTLRAGSSGALTSGAVTSGAATLRAGSSVATFVVVAGVVVVLLVDAVLRGNWPVASRIAGAGALIVWAAWMLLFRPSIRVRSDRAIVINVGRITEVPWARVVDIRRRLQLIVELDDGRTIEAWGSPFAPRRHTAGDPALTVLRGAWMSAPAGTGTAADAEAATDAVIRRVDARALLAGAAAVILLVLGWAVAG